MALWYDEVHQGDIRFGLRCERTLFMGKSPYQTVSVIETSALGKALLIDDLWMCTLGPDEATYHEMLVHPALTTAPKVERVLIIGGGDGGTAREVLRHPDVKHVDMVEIDGMVIDACREHMPEMGAGAWEDPRFHLTVGDGIAYVKDAQVEPYDVILVDGSDPVGPAEGLFNEAFYQGCARLLAPNGVIATQSESPLFFKDVHVEMVKTMEKVFGHAYPYYGTISIYPGGAWSWTYASRTRHPVTHLDEARAERVESWSKIYNRDVHRGAFAVPNHIKKALGR